jgi:hypothetical protein
MSVISSQLIVGGNTVAAGAGANRKVVIGIAREGVTSVPVLATCTWGALGIGAGITQLVSRSQATSGNNCSAYLLEVAEADIPAATEILACTWTGAVGGTQDLFTVVTLADRLQVAGVEDTDSVMVESSALAEPITGTLTCSDDSDQVSAGAFNINRSCTPVSPLTEVRDEGDGTAYRAFSQAGHTTTGGSIAYGVSAFSVATNSGAMVAASFAAAPAVDPPVKTAATVDSATAATYTLGAEYTEDSTEYAVAMPVGTADPNAAAIVAGTGATGTASNAQTAATPDTYGLTPSHTLKHPIYDIHRIARNAGGDSAITRHYDEPLDPPAGKQFNTASAIPWGLVITAATATNPPEFTVAESLVTEDWDTGDTIWLWEFTGGWAALNAAFDEATQDWIGRTITVTGTNTFTVDVDASAFGAWASGGFAAIGRSLFEGATPAIANGDVCVLDLVTAPGGFPITPLPGGAYEIDSGGSAAQQTFAFNVFRIATSAYDVEVSIPHNNPGPVINEDLGDEIFNISLAIGSAPTNIDLRAYASDPNGEALAFTQDASSPDTLAEVGGVIGVDGYTLTLNPTTAIVDGALTIRATDPGGRYITFTLNFLYGVSIPAVRGSPSAFAAATIVALGFVLTIEDALDVTVEPGAAIGTSPSVGAIAAMNSAVTLFIARSALLAVIEARPAFNYSVAPGSTGVRLRIRILTMSGAPRVGVAFNTEGFTLQYQRTGADPVTITPVAISGANAPYTPGGFVEIGDGYYFLDVPNDAFVAGVALVYVAGSLANAVVIGAQVDLVAAGAGGGVGDVNVTHMNGVPIIGDGTRGNLFRGDPP